MKLNGKKKSIFLLSIFLISIVILFSSLQNANAFQTDDDLTVTVHGKLETSSSEFATSLITPGSYNFYEQPELDVAKASHDYTTIDVSSIQLFNKSQRPKNDYNLIGANATSGNHSLTYNNLNEYDTSAPFDTRISAFVNYSSLTYPRNDIIFSDTIDSNQWSLYNNTNNFINFTNYIVNDTSIHSNSPDTNYGNSEYFYVGLSMDQYDTLLENDNNETEKYFQGAYLKDNASIQLYIGYTSNNPSGGGNNMKIYSTSDFDEIIATWNNQPPNGDNLVYVEYYDNDLPKYVVINLGTTYYQNYKIRHDWWFGIAAFVSSENTNPSYANYKPYLSYYLSKQFQGSGYSYVQTNETETLQMRSSVYEDKTTMDDMDYFNVSFQTNTTKEVKLRMIDNGSIIKEYVLLPSGNTNFDAQSIIVYNNEDNIQFNQLEIVGEFDAEKYFKLYDVKGYGNWPGDFIDEMHAINFTYQILGVNYTQDIKMYREYNNTGFKTGNYSYYFDSTEFSNYDYVNDLKIPLQDLYFKINFNLGLNVSFSINISYSSNTWRVPSEVNLRINGEDVVDETYNSGYVHLKTYSETLVATASAEVCFSLNITVSFSFSFDLEVISRTCLEKSFALLSDHLIVIEEMDFPQGLEIKKIYLNNDDLGSDNPNYLSTEMDTGNIFVLMVILKEEMYLPLQYVYSNLGQGSSNFYLTASCNTFSYEGITRYNDLSVNLPTGMGMEYSDLTFSDIMFNPYYLPDDSNDLSGSGSETASHGEETVSWDSDYYQNDANGTKIGESGNSGYKNIYAEYFDSETGEMVHLYYPDNYNSSYNVNGILEMINMFPEEYHEEIWDSWTAYYDSEYTNSSFSLGEFYSRLNTYNSSLIASRQYVGSPDPFPLDIGKTGTDIAWVDGLYGNDANMVTEIIASSNSHKNVMKISSDGDNGKYYQIVHDFPGGGESSGSREWWAKYTDNGVGNYAMNLYDVGVLRVYIYFNTADNKLYSKYGDGLGGFTSVSISIASDTWTHLRVDFDCGTDKYTLYVNGTKLVDDKNFHLDATSTTLDNTNFGINGGAGANALEFHVDAWGDPADPDYSLGDNLYFNLINGTIHFPYGDLNTIDSNYTTFQSTDPGLFEGTHSFTGLEMENNTYYGSPDNFNDEVVGTTGTDIAFVDSLIGVDPVVEIMGEVGNHKNCLKHERVGNDTYMIHSFPNGAENAGSREFWIRISDDVNNVGRFILQDQTGNIQIRFNGGQMQWLDQVPVWNNFFVYAADTWYLIRIDWRADNTHDIYVNGVLKIDNETIAVNQDDGIEQCRTLIMTQNNTMYLDAWGDPADANYLTGYNINPYDITGIWDGIFSTLYCAHDSYIKITDLDGHSDVLELYDNETSGDVDDSRDEVGGNISLTAQISGTIELWVRGDDVSKILRFFGQSGGSTGVYIQIITDKIQYYYGGAWHDATGGGLSDDTWYHFRITFDCNADTYDFYLNGSLLDSDIPFYINQTSLNTFTILTHNAHTNYTYYVDAIGFSWDPNYDIGDNLYDCKLNFTVSINLDDLIAINDDPENTLEIREIYYSFKTNQSQLFNLSIYNFDTSQYELINSSNNYDNFYELVFTIDLSCHLDSFNNTLLKFEGYNYSNTFELYLEELKIIYNWTKTGGNIYGFFENDVIYSFLNHYDGFSDYQKLYNITLKFKYDFTKYTNYINFARFNGSYLATYDFHDELGRQNEEISFIDSSDGDGNVDATIIAEKDGHYNVMDIYDNNPGGSCIFNDNINDQSSGTVSFFAYLGVKTSRHDVQIIDDGNVLMQLRWEDDGNLEYKDDTGYHVIESYNSGQWYFVSIVFDHSNDEYSVRINSVLKEENINFVSGYTDGINQMSIQSDPGSSDFHFYFDAIDYSWDNVQKEYEYNFIFDSTSLNNFTLDFNITNGMLNITEMNYTIRFECKDLQNKTVLYQYFKLDPSISLDYLQSTRGNFLLNFTMNFTASSDHFYDFYNSINNSLFLYNLSIQHEDGWTSIVYNINSSIVQDVSINITQILNDLGKNKLLDFYIEFYLSGNPSELEIDDLILFDFDDEFYEVKGIWIDDTIVVSKQEIMLSWIAVDRYISHVEIDQEFQSVINQIFNVSLINDTIQNVEFYNETSEFYTLNLTFYDNYDNWERWSINYTIISVISISTAYENPVLAMESNNFSVHISSSYSIYQVFYDNSTNYIKQYDNSSYPIYLYDFDFNVIYSYEHVYDVSIKVSSIYGDDFYCNISNIHVVKIISNLDVQNLKSQYDQDDFLNATVSLKDIYNQPIDNVHVNYTLEDPDSIIIVNSSSITGVNGDIQIYYDFALNWTHGYYHLNASYDGSTQYLMYWELTSFILNPIERSVNSTDIALKVDSHDVIDNFIRINGTSNFLITLSDNATFDLTIDIILNYTENVPYEETFDYTFTFQATDDVISLGILNANISSVPANFSKYYLNDVVSTDYSLNVDNLGILGVIGDDLYNGNSFEVKLRYHVNAKKSYQMTSAPKTNVNSVEFQEHLLASRDYSYWYFSNVLTMNSISLEQLRTGDDITSFSNNGSMYYFEKASLEDDLFVSTIDYDPNWKVSYTYTSTGTACTLRVSYKADLNVDNVTIVLDLEKDNLWMDEWDNNRTQDNSTFILELSRMNFTTTSQSITIRGTSDTPTASISSYECQEFVSIDNSGKEYEYRGYVKYSTYSQTFKLTGIKNNWTLDGMHYEDITMTIRKSDGYFSCSGFDSSITSSYLKFKANPVKKFYIEDNEIDKLTINIDCNLPIGYGMIIFSIPSANRYRFKTQLTNLTSMGEILENDFYMFLAEDLKAGHNKIEIEYVIYNLTDTWVLLVPLILFSIGVLGLYYYMKRKEINEKIEAMTPKERDKFYREMAEKGGLLTQGYNSVKEMFRKKTEAEKEEIKKEKERKKKEKKGKKIRTLV